MGLKLTMKPNERLVINGCVVRNTDRRQVLHIENHADVVRESDLLDEKEAGTPVKEAYFFIQTALLSPDTREKIVPAVQKRLGQLVPLFHDDIAAHIFDAAGHVSTGNFYKAMRALRAVMDYETELYSMLNKREKAAVGK